MTGVIAAICKKVKQIFNEKGQDVVEFALLCAFCVGIGLFVREVGFSEAIGSSYSAGKPELLTAAIGNNYVNHTDSNEQQQSGEKTYTDYFNEWRDTSLSELANKDKAERIKADQLALQLIAKAFIGKKYTDAEAGGVRELMTTFTRGENLKKIDKFKPADGQNGYSEATLVPLSYQLVNEENGSYYTWLQTDENRNLVSQVLANNAQIVSKEESGNLKRTKVEDGIFYSDGMISSDGNQLRTVNLRLHYTNGVVDSVDIAARQGGWNGTVVSGLNLNVTESGYTVNDKDYVLNPNLQRN